LHLNWRNTLSGNFRLNESYFRLLNYFYRIVSCAWKNVPKNLCKKKSSQVKTKQCYHHQLSEWIESNWPIILMFNQHLSTDKLWLFRIQFVSFQASSLSGCGHLDNLLKRIKDEIKYIWKTLLSSLQSGH